MDPCWKRPFVSTVHIVSKRSIVSIVPNSVYPHRLPEDHHPSWRTSNPNALEGYGAVPSTADPLFGDVSRAAPDRDYRPCGFGQCWMSGEAHGLKHGTYVVRQISLLEMSQIRIYRGCIWLFQNLPKTSLVKPYGIMALHIHACRP